jgi:hypothetical protein
MERGRGVPVLSQFTIKMVNLRNLFGKLSLPLLFKSGAVAKKIDPRCGKNDLKSHLSPRLEVRRTSFLPFLKFKRDGRTQ